MSTSQAISESLIQSILDRWIAQTIGSYPAEVQSRLRSEDDPFRNPVGQALKENLAVLLRELFGEMNRAEIAPALEALIRIRAVQDFSPADAVRFVFDLRPIVRELTGETDEALQTRIDALCLASFDFYMNCREQVFALRTKEIRSRAQWAAQ
jgi:hypothetical protein